MIGEVQYEDDKTNWIIMFIDNRFNGVNILSNNIIGRR